MASRFIGLVAVLALNVLPAAAQPVVITDPVRLRAEGLSNFSAYGGSLAFARDLAFVGAYQDTVGPPHFPNYPDNRVGAVYAFNRRDTAWEPADRLIAADIVANSFQDGSQFGWDLAALDTDGGPVVLVGAPLWNGYGPAGINAGRAYVFHRDQATGRWAEEAALRPASLRRDEEVGRGVALAESKFGLVAVLGAPGYRDGPDAGAGGPAGRAYVFTRDPATGAWTEGPALDGCLARGPLPYVVGSLGESVAATATPTGVVVAFAGRAPVGAEENSSAGCVYARDDTGPTAGPWVLQATLTSDPPGDNGTLSTSVAAGSGETGRAVVVLGLSYEARAYVYERVAGATSWALTSTLGESEDAAFFGRSSGLARAPGGYVLVVGASFDQRFGPNTGGGYVYRRTEGGAGPMWELAAVLGPLGTLDYGYLGSAAAVSPDGAVALGTSSPTDMEGEGRAYVYDVSALFPVAGETPTVPTASGRLVVSGPNPARGAASVSYALAEASTVEVAVFDGLGREVARVAEGARGAGAHRESFAVSGWPAGVYVVRLTAAGSGRAGARRESVRLVVAR